MFLFAALAAAAVAAIATLADGFPDGSDWLTFAALAVAAAVAQHLLIPVGRNQGFPLAVVFLVAGVLLLPPPLVALMAIAQHVPDTIFRRFPRYITAFNTANYTLSALAAWGAAELVDELGAAEDARWAAAGAAAAVVLVAVNHGMLAVMLQLARGRSVRASGVLAPGALLADLALASLGVVFARVWLSNPYLIPLALAPLVLIHRSFTLLARLGETEERFRAMFESAPTGTVMLDLDERIVSSNRAFEALLGFDKAELAGRRLDELLPGGEDEAEPLREMLAGDRERHGGQLRLRRRDGSEVLGQVAASLVLDAQRRPRFVIAMVEDLTERMGLEEQLRHSQRMEAVGQLAGGVAHDFNNLLTIIAGRTRFALRELGPHAPVRSDLEEIAAAAERAADLTRQLLAYSRRQVLQPSVVDVNQVVAQMERMLRRLIGEHIEIDLELAADAGRVLADRGRLEQVIVNLAVNARDAMEDGGRLSIRTANVEIAEPGGDDEPPMLPGRHVVLSVQDTGRGMDEVTRSRVFEPFFTTKDAGKGTGLGLSTVYGIVTQSGGRIRVESSPGDGSTFSVYLPVVAGQEATERRPAPGIGDLAGSETVLLAEDDDGVRALAELVLARYGYRVLGARNGIDALRIAHEHDGRIDLLLTDVIMPRMKGPELAEALTAALPDVRVVYMSGYADASMLPDADAVAVVAKPFSEEALVRVIRDELDRSPTPA